MVKEHEEALRKAGYENIQIVGEGGSADVYKFLVASEKYQALKVFKKPYDGNWVERIKRECLILSKLDHEGLAKVYPPGIVDVGEFLAVRMEYIHGVSLLEYGEHTSFSEVELLTFLVRLSDVLEYVHDSNIIHRDIHAGNIILRDMQLNDPVIVDFSLARDYSLPELQEHEEYHTFRPIGAMSHCSPEKWLDPHGAKQASDIFSVGVMVFRLLCKESPYFAKTYLGLFHKISRGESRSMGQYRPDISDDFCQLLDDMLEPDIVRRVWSAKKLRQRVYEIIRKHA